MVTAARAIVECLLREGVDHIFGIPGTQNLPLIDALRDTPAIRYVLTRHEQGAAFMAYGFARASGRPGIVTSTEGPGVTNLVTGIAAAYKGFVPVISLCGIQEDFVRERDANQDIDQTSLFRPITRWAYSIPSAHKAQESMRKAFRVALSHPTGPVHIDTSRDVFLEETELEDIAPAAYRTESLPNCPESLLNEVVKLMERAERPLFVVGGGVLKEGLIGEMQHLAELTQIPVAALQYSPDAFPSTHSLALGPLGRNGWASANHAAPRADLIVAIGAHIDVYSTTFRYGVISREAKLVHHAVSPSDIGVVYPVALGLSGSTRSFVEGLTARLESAGRTWPWLDVPKARADWDAERFGEVNAEAVPIASQYLAATMRKVLPRDGMMILDAGNAGKHMRVYFDTYEGGTFMSIDDWASVGGAFPIGLGAKLARPERPVMCTVGDMGMMCNIGEIETAVREHIPVVCVVYNDQGLGNERAYQNELYGGRQYAVDYGDVDFAALARTLGAFGERVTDPADLEPALHRALASNQPAIVDVVIDQGTLAPVVFHP
ncbi:MAG: thiamine pyrophosphate-binding protein [Chloroflexi bacterium]|nr:thiamine pyrophosphate-binding protein [Chloroflexota bacterium]